MIASIRLATAPQIANDITAGCDGKICHSASELVCGSADLSRCLGWSLSCGCLVSIFLPINQAVEHYSIGFKVSDKLPDQKFLEWNAEKEGMLMKELHLRFD